MFSAKVDNINRGLDKYRLSYYGRGDSLIARRTISYLSRVSTVNENKYDIVTKAIKLVLLSLGCDNPFITYLHFIGKYRLLFCLLSSMNSTECS